MPSSAGNMLVVGVISGPHGVRGQVKIKTFTEDLGALLDFQELFDSKATPLDISITGQAKGQLIATISGITDRNDAEALKGTEIFVSRDELPDIDEDDTFYIEDLKGLEVRTDQNTTIGTITNIANYGAGDIVDISFNTGKRKSYSFTKATFPTLAIAEGWIEFSEPDELEAKAETEES